MSNKKPRVVALLGQKGGSGKTTLAVHAAVAAQQDGQNVGIFDTDPQASAHSWVSFRRYKDPAVALIHPDQVEQFLATAQKLAVTLVVIDTPPHATTSVYDAIVHADLVLIPCRPSILDLSAIEAAVSIAEAAKRPSVFILNGCPPWAPEIASTREVLETYAFPIAPVTIGHRQAYVRAMASGQAVTEFEPSGVAAEEMRQLWKWIQGSFK
jgi:chromosome partitioning protein